MKKLFLLLVFLFAAAVLPAKTTIIYHTSDTHGFFYPRDGKGGFAALAAVLHNGPRNYLLLDGGDFAEGTVETQRSKGLKAVMMLNQLNYDAATVGNHEFAFKEEGFQDILNQAQFAVLAANLTLAETGKYPSGVLPYKIFNIDGVKVAVIGLANQNPTKPIKKYHISEPFAALQKALSEVEAQQPAVVVVLAHDSLADDRMGHPNYIGDIGRMLGGRVHVVLGGHAHKIFQNEYRGGVLFAESGYYLKYVTKVTVETDDQSGEFVSAKSELIPLDIKKTGENKEVKKAAEALRESGVDDVVGQTSAVLEKTARTAGHKDSPADNWVADALCREVQADVCIHNTGGARTGLPEGEVIRRDIIDLYPFDDTIMTGQVSGAFLEQLVKAGLTPWVRLAYCGLNLSYSQTEDGKIEKLKIWIHGKRLNKKAMYTVAINSYMGRGRGEGKLFGTLPQGTMKPAGEKTMRQILEDDLKHGILNPPPTGRIVEK